MKDLSQNIITTSDPGLRRSFCVHQRGLLFTTPHLGPITEHVSRVGLNRFLFPEISILLGTPNRVTKFSTGDVVLDATIDRLCMIRHVLYSIRPFIVL